MFETLDLGIIIHRSTGFLSKISDVASSVNTSSSSRYPFMTFPMLQTSA
jgi:hypothetical protein